MFQMLLLFAVVLVVFLLKQTLFKRSKCRGNIPMAGKTVIITGERVWGGGDASPHLSGGSWGTEEENKWAGVALRSGCVGMTMACKRRLRLLTESSEVKITVLKLRKRIGAR